MLNVATSLIKILNYQGNLIAKLLLMTDDLNIRILTNKFARSISNVKSPLTVCIKFSLKSNAIPSNVEGIIANSSLHTLLSLVDPLSNH